MARPSQVVAFVFQFLRGSGTAVQRDSMATRATTTVLLSVLLAAPMLSPMLPVEAAGESLHIELNRLEDRDDGCRVHLVLENKSPRAYSSYRLDLVVFAADGIISRRLALEAAPLRASKTMVKEFELVGLACGRVGRILLNDVSACTSDAGDGDDCVAATRVSSRSSVGFVK
jgi:hypothetical protein